MSKKLSTLSFLLILFITTQAQTDESHYQYKLYKHRSRENFKTSIVLGGIGVSTMTGGVLLASKKNSNGMTATGNLMFGITLLIGGFGSSVVALPFAVGGIINNNKAKQLKPIVQPLTMNNRTVGTSVGWSYSF